MVRILNKATMSEYLPIIRSIQASLDIRLQDPAMEGRKSFRIPGNLGDKYGYVQLAHAMRIIHDWIAETGIVEGTGQDSYTFVKTTDTGLWSRMHELIEENLAKHEAVQGGSAKATKKTNLVINLPENTEWEVLELRFKDAHTITVSINGKLQGSYDCADLGFIMGNTKDKKPDKQWMFLERLALLEQHRNLRQPTKSSFLDSLKTTSNGIDQIKKNLSKQLQSIFQIPNDPFYPYDPDRGYQLKFALKPESLLMDDGELHSSGSELFEEGQWDPLNEAD